MKKFEEIRNSIYSIERRTEITKEIRNKYKIDVRFVGIPLAKQEALAKVLLQSLEKLSLYFEKNNYLLNPSGKMKIIFAPHKPYDPMAKGEYKSREDALYLYGQNPNILAHELFHAIDFQCARSLGLEKGVLLSDYIFILSRSKDPNIYEFSQALADTFTGEDVDRLKEMFSDLMHRSMNYDDVYFGKSRYNCLPSEIMARTFEACVEENFKDQAKLKNLFLYSDENIHHHSHSAENSGINRFPTDEELKYIVPTIENTIERVP